MATWIADCTERAIRHAESPIEKACMGGLLLRFLFDSPHGALVTQPLQNAKADAERISKAIELRWALELAWDRHVENYNEDLAQVADEHKQQFKAEDPLEASFEDYCKQLVSKGKLKPDDYDTIVNDPIVSAGWLAWSAFILSPQSVFPGLGAGSRDARVDLYIWCPAQPKLQMIVECDGYEFHGNKDSFTADRQRDRNLQRAGYQVFRFSGTELFNDMKKVADEAFVTAVALRFGVEGGEKELDLT
ncbi:DUF559 domain-containing protein [Roseateles sp. SL47]|uniref:endonuclease domain-containing protein n=1 Tax=Roseateles sp. SL47 TaxID=2995138 RepID=UPI00226F27A1|nr:DUF559 domain-containing protein [Roseateles sp. SL47]WAC74736.1 DUF559 domain-containing protein [Roseateles sp. SL47]